MIHLRQLAPLLLAATLGACAPRISAEGSGAPAPASGSPRVVVTTDPELDDSNSLVRYLLYATDFRTEAIVYASSQFHWKGDGTGKKWFVPGREYTRFGLSGVCPCESWRWAPGERFIDDAVERYERVYPALRVHHPGYPAPAELKSRIYRGNVEFDGDLSKETPGSNRIRDLLLDDEPGPLYLLAWGGQSTIARALKSIEERYRGTPEWPAIHARVSRKAILSTSGDQDDTGARYIRPTWPDIRTLPAGWGGVPLAYGAAAGASEENARYYGVEWTRENVSSRGPLGAFYRVWGDGKQMVPGDIFDFFHLSGHTAEQLRAMGFVVWTPPRPSGEFIGEGDTFTYLNLLDNGLVGYGEDSPGGWGGHGLENGAPRARPAGSGLGVGATTTAARPPSPDPNFVPAAQNDFAARLKWSVTPRYADANHEPAVRLVGSARLSARSGETVRLQGAVSDPDGDRLRVRWWQWKDVDSYPGVVALSDPASLVTTLRVPADAGAGQTIHLVLEATDDGTPALTRYARVIVTVAE